VTPYPPRVAIAIGADRYGSGVLGTQRLSDELPAWTDRLAELVAGADPGTPVPTCPEWTISDLAKHVGDAFRWMTTIVATRSTELVRPRDRQGRKKPELAGVPDWLREGAAELVAAVRSVGPDTTVWAWAGGSAPAAFWVRRMTYEMVVHTADAALALGQPVVIEADLGADGVDEWLEVLPFVHPDIGAQALGAGRSMHLHAIDSGLGPDGEWLIRGTTEGMAWEHGHGKADVAVRGGAGPLFLLLYRRLPADDSRFEIHGDRPVLDTWLAGTGF
jgi:uncharacterized protein (TIGR03083 family)